MAQIGREDRRIDQDEQVYNPLRKLLGNAILKLQF